jgi:hypothetical protein
VAFVEITCDIKVDFSHFFVSFFGVEDYLELGLLYSNRTILGLKLLAWTSKTILQLILSVSLK